jgi:murein DD-endopeptidase
LQAVKRQVLAKLKHQLHIRYRWGGISPRSGFDCSGLVYYAYSAVLRVELPRTANGMYHFSRAPRVQKKRLSAGDLVFFHMHHRWEADHMGVYLGHGRFIQAPCTGERVHISNLNTPYWRHHYLGARRLMTLNNIR